MNELVFLLVQIRGGMDWPAACNPNPCRSGLSFFSSSRSRVSIPSISVVTRFTTNYPAFSSSLTTLLLPSPSPLLCWSSPSFSSYLSSLPALGIPDTSALTKGVEEEHKSLGQARVERLWLQFFSDPSQWWDNRSNKRTPRSPDFKHKNARKALWICNDFSPPWIHARLITMLEAQQHHKGVLSTPDISAQLLRREQLWQMFFLDPSQWWNNRLLKKSPKYPDFKHKQTHEGLWVEGRLNPPWVKKEMVTMGLLELQSGDGLHSRVLYCSNGDYVSRLCQEDGLKKALDSIELMVQLNFKVPVDAYVAILKECSKRQVLMEGKRVHALIIQSGLISDIVLGNILVDMYAKCGSLLDAREVFDEMPERNVFSWTSMISAYASYGQSKDAFALFQQMQNTGIAPDKVSCIVILKACARTAALEQGKVLHSYICRSGFEQDVIVGSALVDMYAKCRSIESALQVFKNMQERNVVTWTALIDGYAQQGLFKEALTLYERMKQEGVPPNNVTYVVLVNACAAIAALKQGRQLYSEILTRGLDADVCVSNALIHMYTKCRCLEDALLVFARMNKPDVISWTAVIAGYAQQGLVQEALAFYKRMKEKAVRPNCVTFVTLLNACAGVAALEVGKQLHLDILKSDCESDLIVGSALVDMYAKCGSLEHARRVFNNMQEHDVVSWNTILTGYAQQGLGRESLMLLDWMQRESVKPNDVTYVSILSACSHSGLLDEGHYLFSSMCTTHDVSPTEDHYACLVDLLGRGGYVIDAEDLVNKMPFEPNTVVWMTLLGASRKLCHVEIAWRAFEKVMKVEPQNAAAYSLLFNICAVASRRDEVANMATEHKFVEQ